MRRVFALGLVAALALVVTVAVADGAPAQKATLLGGTGYDISDENAPPSAIAGTSAKMTANATGATVNVRTNSLNPGHAYTMWIVYFNNASDCQGPYGFVDGLETQCNEPDLVLGADSDGLILGDAGVTFGNGHVVGNNGKATFSARLNIGDGTVGQPAPPFGGSLYATPLDSDFHVVLRDHGPADLLPEQINSFGGGCDVHVCADTQLFILEQLG